jgi:hypothetical protein
VDGGNEVRKIGRFVVVVGEKVVVFEEKLVVRNS